ncbi:MAG: methyltransferase domain-containing protein [Pseudomonadota bacterium]
MRTEEEMVAYALEIEPELLPFIPELLQDLEELGSDSDIIIELLEDLDVPEAARVVDLGCGKGAVSIAIAEELGFEVLGIDLFEPFIESCKSAAQEEGVDELCTFKHADIIKLAGTLGTFDIAIFAALGDTLAPLQETIGIIRQFVKPGGYIVISDDYLKEGGSAYYPGFEDCVPYAETIARLQAHGDVVIDEIIEFESEDQAHEEDLDENAAIRRRAEELAGLHPELADAFLNFADGQQEETDFIEENLVPVTWLLQRT